MQINNTNSVFKWTSENFTFFLLVLFTFLFPLTFSPSQYVNFFFSKTILLFLVTIISLFFLIYKIFQEGKYKVSFHPLFLISFFIPIWYLISSFFAVNKHVSLIGGGIQTDTTSFVALLFLFAFLVTYFLRSKDKIFLVYLSFGGAYIVLAIYQILRLFFGPNFLSLNLFLSTTSNTIGKWNEISIISSVAVLLSLLSVEFLKLSRGMKIFSYVVLVLGVFLTAVTNFPIVQEINFYIPVFAIVGLFSLIFFVYFLSASYGNIKNNIEDEENETKTIVKRKIPVASLVVLIVSLIFTFGFSEISSFLQTHFNVSSYEERPTWSMSTDVAINSLKQKPFTGYGPGFFNTSWSLNKPVTVNPTPLWKDDFILGVGYIPSTIVTLGPIGFIAWVTFLGFFVYLGFKSLFAKYKDRFSHYLTVSSFLVALFLWIVAFIYTPTIVILILTFLFTATFIASLLREETLNEKVFNFENNKEKTFVSIMVLVILLVGSIFWAYSYGRVFAASIFSAKGATQYANAANINDLFVAQDSYVKALMLSSSDADLRAVTSINLSRAQLLLNDKSQSADDLRASFVNAYQNAYGAANDAVNYNKNEYLNYITRGSVSESIVALGVQTVEGSGVGDAYQDAKNNYELAQKLNPLNPFIELLLGRLELNNKNFDSAKDHISKALKLKANYPDAYLLLAQIQLSQNDSTGAINTLTAGSIVSPDANLFYTLGNLRYSNKDYTNAVDAFEKAVILNPYFSNARYFLALSYYNLGRKEDALIQLNQIKALNPNNTDIDNIINTLNSGQTLNTGTPSADATSSSTLEIKK